jgi:hypothetical protein
LFQYCTRTRGIGLAAIVLAHNVWSGGALPVLVTVVGWISLVKGLIVLLLSFETSATYFEALRYGQLFYVYMGITLVIGIYLHSPRSALLLSSPFRAETFWLLPSVFDLWPSKSIPSAPRITALCSSSSAILA